MFSMDNSSNMLVGHIQKYASNISSSSPIYIQPRQQQQQHKSTYGMSSSFPSSPMYYEQQQVAASPPNTQVLFSDSYFSLNSQQQWFGYVTNVTVDPINQLNTLQHHRHRPITKKQPSLSSFAQQLNVKTSPINIINNNSTRSSNGYYSSAASSFTSPTLSSAYSPASDSTESKYNCKNNKSSLPIRSQAVDLSAHIENAKKLKVVCNKKLYCTFCKNNNETEEVYSSHLLKDSTGKIQCPVLQLHKCPICGESGEKAHTITYCKDFKKSKRLQMIQKAQQVCQH